MRGRRRESGGPWRGPSRVRRVVGDDGLRGTVLIRRRALAGRGRPWGCDCLVRRRRGHKLRVAHSDAVHSVILSSVESPGALWAGARDDAPPPLFSVFYTPPVERAGLGRDGDQKCIALLVHSPAHPVPALPAPTQSRTVPMRTEAAKALNPVGPYEPRPPTHVRAPSSLSGCPRPQARTPSRFPEAQRPPPNA